MKIVILDAYVNNPGDLSWKRFEQMGEFTYYDTTPSWDKDLIRERIGDAQAVLVSDTRLDAEIIKSCPSIRYIGVLSTGYDMVDVEQAARLSIPVCHIPAYGTDSVSQHAIALLLELTNRAGHHSEAVKAGRWWSQPYFCFWDYSLMELSGKTLGVIGYGRIGQKTAMVAMALGMEVLFYDRAVRPDLEGTHCHQTDLDTLLSRSDVITLHCPLTNETRELINQKTIKKMKQGVLLINCARGALIHEKDLAQALSSGKVGGAGLDVVAQEPISWDNPLLLAPNCIITPHNAWASRESRARLLDVAADNLESFIQGRVVNNCWEK